MGVFDFVKEAGAKIGIGDSKDDKAEKAAPRVQEILLMAKEILDGFDANDDGKVTWHEGEGGLLEAKKHMGFMMTGENMKMM